MRLSLLLLGLFTVALLHAQPLSQRYLWTWDHRMDWAGTGRGGTVMGGGTYAKPAEEFLQDYKTLLDYMHDHTSFNALIIWGFLRDSHGGVKAAQELCEYANARGIRIIPGVGTSGYEGYYFQGNHQYNVTTWLKQHPELRAVNDKDEPHNALCPSRPENIKWLNDGCRWMFETFKIGGLNFEIGDFFVCYCDGCKTARAAIPGNATDYYKDMAVSTAPVAKLAREIAPDAWLSYATYTGFTPEMAQTPPEWVSLIPPEIICQWTLTSMVSDQAWPAGVRPPTALNTGYLHWGNKSTQSVQRFFLRRTQDVCRRAAEAGLVGLVTYGEDPDSIFSMKLFYDAWSYFLEHPGKTVDDYGRERLAAWFDSPAEAARLLGMVQKLEREGLTRTTLGEAATLAREAVAEAPNARAKGTWEQLAAFLARELADIEAQDRVLTDPAEVAKATAEGFRVRQECAVSLTLTGQKAETLELKVRVDYHGENGILPVMKLSLNETALGPERALERAETIATPNHDAYKSLAAFEGGAWRVKYDEDFELSPNAGQKYFTPEYSPVFRFRIGDLWRDGGNVLRIENLEARFRPSEQGVLVVGQVKVE